jgi:hypothetical protein
VSYSQQCLTFGKFRNGNEIRTRKISVDGLCGIATIWLATIFTKNGELFRQRSLNMSTGFRLIPAIALSVSFLASPALSASGSDAAFKDCTCVTAQVAGQPVANLSAPAGSVLYSGSKGYTKATKAVTLSDGSVVAVGTASSARVTSGTGCDIAIEGNSMVSVSTPDGPAGNVCIKVAELTPAAFASLQGAGGLAGLGALGGSGIGLGAGLTGGLFLLGAGLIAISN